MVFLSEDDHGDEKELNYKRPRSGQNSLENFPCIFFYSLDFFQMETFPNTVRFTDGQPTKHCYMHDG